MTPLDELLGDSPGIQTVRATLKRLLALGARGRLPPLLILGDTGTGKGLLTRVFHRAGPRAAGPLVEVNCAAIPEALLEAELFGFERGAFTGAHQAKPGLFQTANGGTLFLDEIGLMPSAVQAKLLKVLEDRAVRRLGSMRSEPADFALVAATSEDLPAAVQAHRFREDLYHRLSVVVVRLPSLAERGTDILRLAEHFLARACADYGVAPKTLMPEAEAALLAFPWSGNIRELANVMERVALLDDAPSVTADVLNLPSATIDTAAPTLDEVGRITSHRGRPRRAPDRAALLAAFEATHGNVAQTAARLGIPRGTLRYQLEKLGLSVRTPAFPALERGASTVGEGASAGPSRRAPLNAPHQWEQRRLAFLRAVLTPFPGRDAESTSGPVLATLGEKVASFGGRVEERGPRDLIAVFGLEPVEDATRRAAHTALALHREAARVQSGSTDGLRLTIVIDVALGLVSETHDPPVIDLETKRATYVSLDALATAAKPDTTLVGVAAVPALARRFMLTLADGPGTEGALRLEGLTRSDLAPAGALITFVGRRPELSLLQSRLELATEGHGQVVGIVGEPGIGKSRLLFEFHQRCRGLAVLRGACVSYGSAIPYLPILGLIRDVCGLTGVEPPEAVETMVRARCQALDLGDEATGHVLRLLTPSDTFGPPDAPAELVRADTFEAVRRLVLQGGHPEQPVVVSVEDVHWIDATSEALLESLAGRLAGTVVILVTTYRAGYRPPWMNSSYATQVALPPLSPDDSRQVVRAIVRDRPVSDSVTERLLARAEGNPFFLEELSRVIGVSASPPVPDTVQDVLQARIDRLPERPRRLLQTAAVIGREVPRSLLLATGEVADALEDVSVLVHSEFLRERSGADGPLYVFKHALTQEVAYASLPSDRQRALHGVIGHALERNGGSDEILAYHFVRAHEWSAALPRLLKAGERAAQALSTREALGFYDEAEAVADRLGTAADPAIWLTIHEARVSLYNVSSDFDRARAESLRAVSMAQRLNDSIREGEAQLAMAWASTFLSDFPQAIADAERGLDIATVAGIPTVAAGAHSIIATVQTVQGQLEECQESIRRALAIERTPDTAPHQGFALVLAGELHHWAGEYAEAITWLDEAVRLMREHRELLPLLEGMWMTGLVLGARGELAGAQRQLEETDGLCEKIGDEVFHHRILNSRGWLAAEQGDLAQALEWGRRGAEAARARGDPETISNAELNLADCYVVTGDYALAHELLSGIRRRVEDPATSAWMQWRYTQHLAASLGELALARGNLAEAHMHAKECIERAARYGSRKYLVRGKRLLADIELAAGRPREAEAPLRDALAVAKAIGNPTQLWKTYVSSRRVYRKLGQIDAADQAHAAALAITEGIRANLPSPAARTTFGQSPLLRTVYGPEE
jgi:DNA-binding NtrC family response regulator/tetratricopeptide (TPR) repeat protein